MLRISVSRIRSHIFFSGRHVQQCRYGASSLRCMSTESNSTARDSSRPADLKSSASGSHSNNNLAKRMKELGITVEDLQREHERRKQLKNRTSGYYALSLLIGTLALSYASVPFYRLLCQKTGWAGTPIAETGKITADRLIPVESNRKITIRFESDVSRSLPWKFEPLQRQVTVTPGETALAFYKATNLSNQDIIGVATYNVTPDQVAPYFSKIQCFCFEQQQLRAGEQVDMPIFFFIDPEFDTDPQMKHIREVVLNYTFFKAKTNASGQYLTIPDAAGNEIAGQIPIQVSSSGV
ncbi:cytochrome c oxidase assembly protein CtaG/Cox11-domain-containing protein [Lipomyces kononenkoae]|uniref:Cytochrome c oxidase assembly protein CtaG/Cox11-domain-containing protein n=1 Tax=Lipomyces kononenkoae TaxID=34357 RepID=A0ACC3T3V9_LIPKO